MTGSISFYKGAHTVPRSYIQYHLSGDPVLPKAIGKRGCVISDIRESLAFIVHKNDLHSTAFTFQPSALAIGTNYVNWSLKNLLQPLLEKSNNIWAFICGGLKAFESNDAIAQSSYAAYQEILELLTTEYKLPFASICGKYVEKPDIAFDNIITTRNNMYMGGNYLSNHLDTLTEPAISTTALADFYDEVNIPDWLNLNPNVNDNIELNSGSPITNLSRK